MDVKNEADAYRRRIPLIEVFAIIFILVIIAINASMAFRTISAQTDRYSSITNTGNVIVAIKDLRIAILSAESGQRGYLLTEEEDYLIPYHEALKNLELQMEAVRMLRTEISDQALRVGNLLQIIDEKMLELKKTVELALNDKESSALKIVNQRTGLNLGLALADLFDEIESHEFELQARLYHDAIKDAESARALFFVFISISAGLVAGILLLLRTSLVKERRYRNALENRAVELEEKVAERTQELLIYAEELNRSNHELEDFAFVASHDLQEPLRKIRAFSDRIQQLYKDKLDEKGIDYLRRLNRSAERMSSLISDLLEFSRIKTRGKEFVETDLNEILKAVIDDLEVAIEDSGATINLAKLPVIESDSSQMNQLFLNLLSNAIKFRHDNIAPIIAISYELTTEVISDVDIEYHTISVKDNGIGLDQSYADKIFVPFQRLHGRDAYGGTGIGLAVCRRIVERHGGSIRVKSTPGKGAEFTILLPTVSVQLDSTESMLS